MLPLQQAVLLLLFCSFSTFAALEPLADNHECVHHRSLRYEILPSNWTWTAYTPSFGNGIGQQVTFTWGIVPDGTPVSTPNGVYMSNLRVRLGQLIGNFTYAKSMIQYSWNLWAEQSGVTIIEEPADDGAAIEDSQTYHAYGSIGVRPDIRIAGFTMDGPGGQLGYSLPPPLGDILLDTDDTFFSKITRGQYVHLINGVGHEGGHTLGLAHTCPGSSEKLMEPVVPTNFTGPRHDDIRGVHRLYGDVYEPNPTIDKSYFVNSQSGVSTSVKMASLHDITDVDFFSFDIGAHTRLKVTIAPNGTSYRVGAQTGDSGCTGSPTTVVNSTIVQRLSFEVYSEGEILLASVNNPSIGTTPTTTIDVSGPGRYYLKVFTYDTTNPTNVYVKPVQLYGITLATSCVNSCINSSYVLDSNCVCVLASTLNNSVSASSTPAVSVSPTRSTSLSGTPSISLIPSVSTSTANSLSSTSTHSITPAPSNSEAPSGSTSAMPSTSQTQSNTPSVASSYIPSETPSETPSVAPSNIPSVSTSNTPTTSVTPLISNSSPASNSLEPSRTNTASPTSTRSITSAPSKTNSRSLSTTRTKSVSLSTLPTPTRTPARTSLTPTISQTPFRSTSRSHSPVHPSIPVYMSPSISEAGEKSISATSSLSHSSISLLFVTAILRPSLNHLVSLEDLQEQICFYLPICATK